MTPTITIQNQVASGLRRIQNNPPDILIHIGSERCDLIPDAICGIKVFHSINSNPDYEEYDLTIQPAWLNQELDISILQGKFSDGFEEASQ